MIIVLSIHWYSVTDYANNQVVHGCILVGIKGFAGSVLGGIYLVNNRSLAAVGAHVTRRRAIVLHKHCHRNVQ